MLPLWRPSASSAVREAALTRPAHRCCADGGLRVVVHAYGRRNPWVLSLALHEIASVTVRH